MLTDEKLMRRLFRTTAFARRKYLTRENEEGLPKIARFKKGFSNILEKLVAEDGVSQQYLADKVGIRPQTASESICAMEEHGLIRREASEEDKRVMLIYLTDEGREYHKNSTEELKLQANEFFSVLSEDEKLTLSNILAKLNRTEEAAKTADNESEGCQCRREK